MLTFMKTLYAVKHKVSIQSYSERKCYYFYITAMLKLFPMTTECEMAHVSNFKGDWLILTRRWIIK